MVYLFFHLSPLPLIFLPFSCFRNAFFASLLIISSLTKSVQIKSLLTSEFFPCLHLPVATFHSAIIGHSIIHKSAPPYILELFPPKFSSRPSCRLSLPSNSHYNKIEQHIVSSFNCAPKSICYLSRLNFKSRLKSHLLSSLSL